jgi:peptidoglycan LD-endopeptidase LytH
MQMYNSHPIVTFNAATETLWHLELTAQANAPAFVQAMTNEATAWIANELEQRGAKYAIGGYAEKRTGYAKSELFNTANEPRCVHLGIDIFAAEGTAVFAPFNATVHSFANNNSFGNYGPTIILKHQHQDYIWYSLYGHLSINDYDYWQANYRVGSLINAGTIIGHFGNYNENVGWTPHLHFQIINDIQNHQGDYPGVSTWSEKEIFLKNSPNPFPFMGLGTSY